MNQMVFELQPEILVNNRNKLEGDFSTPEQEIKAAAVGRAWENCMTLNDSWGYNQNDDAWKTPKVVVNNLATCARDGGNYLLNIGPMPDGSIPPETTRILEEVGQWMQTNGKAIYGADRCPRMQWNPTGNFTRKGNTLYLLQRTWPGHTPAAEWLEFYQPETVIALGGLKQKVLSARLLKTGQKVNFTQDSLTLRLTGLPTQPPDHPVSVIELECDGIPEVFHEDIRPLWPRNKADIGI